MAKKDDAIFIQIDNQKIELTGNDKDYTKLASKSWIRSITWKKSRPIKITKKTTIIRRTFKANFINFQAKTIKTSPISKKAQSGTVIPNKSILSHHHEIKSSAYNCLEFLHLNTNLQKPNFAFIICVYQPRIYYTG